MLKSKESSQNEYEFVTIDELVPDDHLLRLIDKYVDIPTTGLFPKWKFTYDKERDLYIFPNNQALPYKTTTRDGYREYKSDSKATKTPAGARVSGDPAGAKGSEETPGTLPRKAKWPGAEINRPDCINLQRKNY